MSFRGGVIWELLRHPVLCWEAIRTWLATKGRGGPGSGQAYLQWRIVTAYGDASATARAHDVVEYLSWRREMRSVRKWGRMA